MFAGSGCAGSGCAGSGFAGSGCAGTGFAGTGCAGLLQGPLTRGEVLEPTAPLSCCCVPHIDLRT